MLSMPSFLPATNAQAGLCCCALSLHPTSAAACFICSSAASLEVCDPSLALAAAAAALHKADIFPCMQTVCHSLCEQMMHVLQLSIGAHISTAQETTALPPGIP